MTHTHGSGDGGCWPLMTSVIYSWCHQRKLIVVVWLVGCGGEPVGWFGLLEVLFILGSFFFFFEKDILGS